MVLIDILISGADIVHQANDTFYGLAAAIFSSNISRALKTAHELKAGTVWVNCVNQLHASVPFGGFKQSGFGRELGEYALDKYVIGSYGLRWFANNLNQLHQYQDR